MALRSAAQLASGPDLALVDAAGRPVTDVLRALHSTLQGLTGQEANRRLALLGPNALRSHRASWSAVLVRQLRSPLLLLLCLAAVASFFVGERTDALIIGVILVASVGLGFGNEFRAERAAEALHSQLRHSCIAWRDGDAQPLDVTCLVPGDVVELELGEVVPADLRLLTTSSLECDESVLSGESVPVEKVSEPVVHGTELSGLSSCAFMGTIIRAGSGRGVVVATGSQAEFGRIAAALGEQQPETQFQIGLRRFSLLLVHVAGLLTAGILVTNLLLDRPFLDALLFSLAIAVGISPQLLPAVVATSLATGSRQLSATRVLVKRLVCIEDLGDIDVLFTDKTGTLTEGALQFLRACDPGGTADEEPVRLGLLCSTAVVEGSVAVGGNPLDVALWNSPAALAARGDLTGVDVLATLPFDHDRRMVSVLVQGQSDYATMIVKGAPENVLARCTSVPSETAGMLAAEFGAGNRVVAVATRKAPAATVLGAVDERDLELVGFLVFLDPPKSTAHQALRRLAALGIHVKVLTGDNDVVAARVCGELGLRTGQVLTGADIDAADDDELTKLLDGCDVFARVSPEHKARLVRLQRRVSGVGFLGDGVNDAVALHAADVGISVDTATDVAKDAADVILLEKDLGVLADGVVVGRRIFANTIKYVLMGTSSNFGNMFSAAGASAFLRFLPMLPSQILLNNLLYDASQLAIPTDNVDEEQLVRPSRWDVAFIRRFMLFFGPISSVFDLATFAVMLLVFDASAREFRSGWFVESLATQALVIFVIRTRRVPFFRSRPSVPLVVAAVSVVLLGAALPETPFAHDLGFTALPTVFVMALLAMVVLYLALMEGAKTWFFRVAARRPETSRRTHEHWLHRRAARFSVASTLPRRRSRSWSDFFRP